MRLFTNIACSIVAIATTTLAAPTTAPTTAPVKVELQHHGDHWTLLRGGEPYFIKGAGGDGPKPLLVALGGNSFRTWGVDNVQDKFAEADRLGLTVTAGIWMQHEGNYFHYSDAAAVQRQLDHARVAVEQYRNEPSVLIWAIGNEMEGYKNGDNPAIWKAVEDVAAMIKKVDPNHPTMTVVAEIGGARVSSIQELCPDIDIVGINSYGGVSTVGERYKQAGGTKPYIVTEFGPPGTWELKKNAIGATNEWTSTQKAAIYRKGYENGVLAEKDLCLGSYVFTWGHKREATCTWYGLFLDDDSELEAVHTMAELWSGKAPANRCPQIEPIKLHRDARVDPGTTVHATVNVTDPDNDPLTIKWVLMDELKPTPPAGIGLPPPPIVDDAIVHSSDHDADVKLPTKPGTYRLYVFASDGHNNSATANVPLKVK